MAGAVPTINDVARKAGVSVATVSRAMRGDHAISEATTRRVKAAVKSLNYRSRGGGRRRALTTVGVVFPDVVNPFFGLMLDGIMDAAYTHSVSCILADLDHLPERTPPVLSRLTRAEVQGIICVPAGADAEPYRADGVLGRPLVFVDRVLDGLDVSAVVCDNNDGAYQACRYLLKLGHRRIAYLGGPADSSTSRERSQGFRRALDEEGVAPDAALVLAGEFSQEWALGAMRTLLGGGRPFTAVLATADVMAFGVMQACKEAGLRIPEDISLVGYDDIPFTASIGLTTVAQPAREMGRNALLLLLDIMQGRISEPRRIVLRPSMVLRSSCGLLPGSRE